MHLSILIPVHNAEKLILRCLDSLLHQGLSENDYEIIMIDDGSTDNSFFVINEFAKAHSNIRLYSQENKGAYYTRNELVKKATGTYVYFVDADDFLAENALSIVLKYALQYKLQVVAFGTKATTNDKYNLEKVDEIIEYKATRYSGEEFIEDNPDFRVEIWWYIVKKNYLTEEQIKFELFPYGADVLFTFQCLLSCSDMLYLDVPIYCYYQSDNSMRRNSDPEKLKKLIDANFSVFEKLSKDIITHEGKVSEKALQVIGKKRDTFIFFLIIKMIRAGYSFKTINKKLKPLKSLKVYPLKTIVKGNRNESVKYKFLNYIVNSKIGLITTAPFFKGIHKIFNKVS